MCGVNLGGLLLRGCGLDWRGDGWGRGIWVGFVSGGDLWVMFWFVLLGLKGVGWRFE